MILNKELLSVPEAAAHCGVSRSTVNNWIQAKRLFARRSGKNYLVPIADLLVLLRSTGKPVPSDLARAERDRALIGSFRHCWEYWEGREQDRVCGDCVVFVNRLAICFAERRSKRLPCPSPCHACRYYQEVFLPRIQFILQMGVPAAVCKGLYFLGANSLWARLCGLPQEAFVGMDIERVFHADSLVNMLSLFKDADWGREHPGAADVALADETGTVRTLNALAFSLTDPPGALLILLATPEDCRSRQIPAEALGTAGGGSGDGA